MNWKNLRAEIKKQNGELLDIRGGKCRIQDSLMTKKEEINRLKRAIEKGKKYFLGSVPVVSQVLRYTE